MPRGITIQGFTHGTLQISCRASLGSIWPLCFHRKGKGNFIKKGMFTGKIQYEIMQLSSKFGEPQISEYYSKLNCVFSLCDNCIFSLCDLDLLAVNIAFIKLDKDVQ